MSSSTPAEGEPSDRPPGSGATTDEPAPGQPAAADEVTEPKEPKHSAVNWPVFGISAALIVAFVLWAWLLPEQAADVIFSAQDWVSTHLGWYYVATAGIVVIFVLVIALTRRGRTKLGPDHSKPRFNLFTWAAMLFAAGIGVDLMFFSIAGPATNILTPPDVPGLTEEAARMAPVWTMFHYGIPGWAMYALMGLAFGLFAYRYHMPLSIRSALAPIFGRRIEGSIGHGVEIAAVIGTIFGIATSLGIGVVFINFGLQALFDVPTGTAVQVALIAVAVAVTIASTVTGVDKGIRRLSELNVVLALVLLVWVAVTGRLSAFLTALVQNIGDFFARLPDMLFETFAYNAGSPALPAQDWMADWTLFFWAWWIAWAPFVGLFLARISRGRTLRQFIGGVLLIPFGFIVLWVSIFGNATVASLQGGSLDFLITATEEPESGFFLLLQQYPGAVFTMALAVLSGLLFYVTSADSGSLVMANMTSKATMRDSDGPPWLRIVWAVVTGALTLVMLFINGVETLQSATLLIGLPFSVVIYLVMISVWRALNTEGFSQDARERSLAGAISARLRGTGEQGSWRQRLRQRASLPTAEQAAKQLTDVAAPALEAVAGELRAIGHDVTVERGTESEHGLPYCNLTVDFGDQDQFKYEAYPVAYPVPSFAASPTTGRETYFKLEVFSQTGSRGHNLMGYSQEQTIADVVDAYDAHLTYLGETAEHGAPTGTVDPAGPTRWEGEA